MASRRPRLYTVGDRETDRLDNKETRPVMSGFKEPSFADRQKAAQQARQSMLNKIRSQPGLDDPAVKHPQAEREAHAAERRKARLAREAAQPGQKLPATHAAAHARAQLPPCT